MPGMMSGEDMSRLETSRGVPFDKLFLQMMIDHHEGAIEMAREEQAKGTNSAAKELAAQIGKAQAAEITGMRQMLAA
jgi:uncharacterized protein (DUF305 family)